jgi:hypothetical protein
LREQTIRANAYGVGLFLWSFFVISRLYVDLWNPKEIYLSYNMVYDKPLLTIPTRSMPAS